MAPAATATASPIDAPTGPIKPVVEAPPAFNTDALFSNDKKTRESSVKELASLSKNQGPQIFIDADLVVKAVKALNDKKSPAAREAVAKCTSFLAAESIAAFEIIAVSTAKDGLFNSLVEAFADKIPAVRNAAIKAIKDLVGNMSPWACAIVMPALLNQIKSNGKWQVKTGGLEVLDQLVTINPSQIAKLTPDIIPVLAEVVWDTKPEVKKAAKESLSKATSLISNKGEDFPVAPISLVSLISLLNRR